MHPKSAYIYISHTSNTGAAHSRQRRCGQHIRQPATPSACAPRLESVRCCLDGGLKPRLKYQTFAPASDVTGCTQCCMMQHQHNRALRPRALLAAVRAVRPSEPWWVGALPASPLVCWPQKEAAGGQVAPQLTQPPYNLPPHTTFLFAPRGRCRTLDHHLDPQPDRLDPWSQQPTPQPAKSTTGSDLHPLAKAQQAAHRTSARSLRLPHRRANAQPWRPRWAPTPMG